MRQLLIRALALLRRPAVLVAVLLMAGGGTALVFVPLLGVPGYELGEALALVVGLLGAVPGIASGFQERRLIQGRDPRPRGAARYDNPIVAAGMAIGAAFLINGVVLVPPFLTSLLHSLWSTDCNPLANIGFFPWLTIPSALIASAFGVLAGLTARGGWSAGGLYLLIVLASLVVTAWPIYFGPQVFAFNPFLGYFPGPLYDEALKLEEPVLWFRLQTFLLAGAVWLFIAFCLDMREGRIRRPHFRPGAAALLGLLVFCVVAISEQGSALGLRMTYRYLEDRLGGRRESTHFRIHYFRGKPKVELDRLERDLEFRYSQLEAFLGGAPKEKISVYVYRSPEEKKQLVGAGGTQFAKPWQLALHINDAPFPHPVMKHELLHVMAAPFGVGPFRTTARYGVIAQMAIVEGVAVAGDNRVDDLTLHQWAAAMRKRDLAPDVRQLFAPEGFYRAPASRAYTVAGSFLRYLADTYGTEKLRALYRSGDFDAVYGKSLDALAAEWERYLDSIPLDERAEAEAYRRFRKPSLFARACAREVATLEEQAADFLVSDPEEALRLYQRCSRLQPEEPSFQLGQARALAELDRETEAEELLAGLESRIREQPPTEAEVAMLHGDVAWKMGRRELARDEYRKVLLLAPGPALERTAQVKLAALDSPVREAPIRAYFERGQEDVKLFLLREAVDRAPDDPYLHYLIGRRLTSSTAPQLALPHLPRAAEQDTPESIRKEALRLLIQAQYLAGDCAAVRQTVGSLPDFGAAFELWAREWVDRCDFEDRVYKGPLVPEGPFR